MGENKHVIFTEYKQVLQKLKESGINFYSYTSKQDQIKSYLLKNIEGNFDENEVLSELVALQIPDLEFIKVSEFKTNNSIAKNKKLPIYSANFTCRQSRSVEPNQNTLPSRNKMGKSNQAERLPMQEVSTSGTHSRKLLASI